MVSSSDIGVLVLEDNGGRKENRRSLMASSLVITHLVLALNLWILTAGMADRKSYVVYMGSHPRRRGEPNSRSPEEVTAAHHEFLGSFLGSKEKARDAIFYSYTKFINGFAAILNEEEADKISKSEGVLVFPNEGRKLQTTRSWQFLGLENDGVVPAYSLWTQARYGEDTIIGNFDTGVWPESASFSDEGLGPVPSRWKGICESGLADSVKCNRKLIGARFFNMGYVAAVGPINATENTPRDPDGHGTHTLATAGGAIVPRASIFGFGNGTAKGGSPRARVAAYRVCWPPVNGRGGCFDADILAAFDAAIHDGVDVLSLSIAGAPQDYFNDGIALGSFHAVKNGISVVSSAGNEGPDWGTVTNVAPWMFTVAASTMDREFSAYATLGNGKRLKGQSLSAASLPPNEFRPLIVSADAIAANSTIEDAVLCAIGSLDPQKVRGKIVVCLVGKNTEVAKSEAVLLAGGVGMILVNLKIQGYDVTPEAYVLPAISLSYEDRQILWNYLNSTTAPMASISSPSTVVGTQPAPFMAYFSSRGPNAIQLEILKPDITAPGVSVLAAFTGATGPSNDLFDERRVLFATLSGTSMSCPHICGIVGLLKTLHPDWSPAAIKSAIMTTATTEDNRRKPILDSFFLEASPFSYGAGHVQPNLAADPGLVYDLTVDDYLHFLCANGYNTSQISTFGEGPFSCPRNPPKLEDLNYPSITVPQLSGRVTVTRKVKNVGSPGTYTAQIVQPSGISVSVIPNSMEFKSLGEEKAFSVSFEAENGTPSAYYFGWLTWSDLVHNVTSPLVIGVL